MNEQNIFIVRYGEVALKGMNKPYFERMLTERIKKLLKRKFENFTVKNLQVPIFKEGKCVYESPSIEEIRAYCKEQIGTLWDETLRFENPQTYYVDLSEKLWDMKHALLKGRP